jgi:RecQ family ATP-dependent DNA helicase
MLKFLVKLSDKNNEADDPKEIENKIKSTLSNVFKLDSFRPNQYEISRALLIEKRDVFVLMPTGAGKSLCYQLPGVVNHGVTLVISPLIALMHDQVSALQQIGVKASFWNSTQSMKAIRLIKEDLESGNPRTKILYTTPESIVSDKLQTILTLLAARNQLSLIAVDEAHCISSWGHDFRPKYRSLSELKKKFPLIPMIALTATATSVVKSDIIKTLRLVNPRIFISSFNRPEITYEVRYKMLLDNPVGDLKNFLRQYPNDSGIIYCRTKRQVDELCVKLSASGEMVAKAYHAGLKLSERKIVQNEWASGKLKIVIATIAFGMGIDKKDVRYVVHWSLPKSIESFYQESGRAGRDKNRAHSLIYYCSKDKRDIKYLLSKGTNDEKRDEIIRKDFQDVCNLCEIAHCRRKFILEFFGETINPDICQGTCDYCKDKTGVAKKIERIFKSSWDTDSTIMSSINTDSNYSASDDIEEIESFSEDEVDVIYERREKMFEDRLNQLRGTSTYSISKASSTQPNPTVKKTTTIGTTSVNSSLLGSKNLLGVNIYGTSSKRCRMNEAMAESQTLSSKDGIQQNAKRTKFSNGNVTAPKFITATELYKQQTGKIMKNQNIVNSLPSNKKTN